MCLPPSFIRKRVENAEGGGPEAYCKPGDRRWLVLNHGETTIEETLYSRFLSRLRLEANEKRDFSCFGHSSSFQTRSIHGGLERDEVRQGSRLLRRRRGGRTKGPAYGARRLQRRVRQRVTLHSLLSGSITTYRSLFGPPTRTLELQCRITRDR